jgi:poly(beta-D-mannuronate) lyase
MMARLWNGLPIAALLVQVALAPCVGAQRTPLRSPWDSHVATMTDTPWSCPALPRLPHDFATNSYYIDRHHSVIDPELKKRYQDSVAPIEGFSRDAVTAADRYWTGGSRSAAECATALLAGAAAQKALTGSMDGHQASYVQGWNLGSWAVAWLKVRSSRVASPAQAAEISVWLGKLAEENRGYYEKKRRQNSTDSANNHLYWAGFAISAAAIATDDRELFEWGMDAYRHGVRDIQDDGTLPMEMDRGQMALHYHLYALAPLVLLAEFGEVNGLDLYAESDYAIRRLVARCIGGLRDPAWFERRTGVRQVTTPQIEAWEIGWAQPWLRRFPDPAISELLPEASRLNYTTWGGLPP